MLRAFLKDGAIYTIPALVSRGLSLFLIPLYTRVLSPEDYGSLDLFTMFANIVNLTISLEVSQGVARFHAAERDPKKKVLYASSALWFTVFCYTIFAVLMIAFAQPFSELVMGQSELTRVFKIGIVYVFFNAIFYLIQNQLRWELRSKQFAIVSLVYSIITAATSVLLTYVLNWGLSGLLCGMLLGTIAGCSFGLYWLWSSFRLQFSKSLLAEMLRFSSPLVLSGIAVWVSLYIDRVMIKKFLSLHEVGLYGVGYRLASLSGLTMVGFQGALTPLIYSKHHETATPSEIAKIFRLVIFISLLVFISLVLFTKDILYFFTTEPFYAGGSTVIYLVPAIFLGSLYIFAPGIGIAKKTHYSIWINIVGASVNLLLNYLLIPHFGIIGASAATMVASLVLFLMQLILSQRFYYVPHRWGPILASVLLAWSIALIIPTIDLAVRERWALNLMSICIFVYGAALAGLISLKQIKKFCREVNY
jgi:O-antigen/teichoic acid export membrane protein